MTDWKALCEELLWLWDAQPLPPHESSWASVIARIRGALDAETVGEGPTDEELESFLVDVAAENGDIYWAEPLVLARAVLARWGHQPAPPAEGEVGELVAALRIESSRCTCTLLTTDDLRRAADLLEQRHPAPVPVAERPWEREGWCDEQGRCWFGWHRPMHILNPAMWMLCSPDVRDILFHQACLPAHALPLPGVEVEQ